MGISHCFRHLPQLQDPRPTSPPDWPDVEIEVECQICGTRTRMIYADNWACIEGDDACCDEMSCIRETVAGLMVEIDKLNARARGGATTGRRTSSTRT